MQRSEVDLDASDSGQLCAQGARIAQRIAAWADARVLLSEVALYGDRLFGGGASSTPLNLAVRYDQSQMIEGFDDWIEQLRTDFAGLRTSVREPLRVLTPDCGDAWSAIIEGVELTASRHGKVRLVSVPALAPAKPRAADKSGQPNWWLWKPSKCHFAAHSNLDVQPVSPRSGH